MLNFLRIVQLCFRSLGRIGVYFNHYLIVEVDDLIGGAVWWSSYKRNMEIGLFSRQNLEKLYIFWRISEIGILVDTEFLFVLTDT